MKKIKQLFIIFIIFVIGFLFLDIKIEKIYTYKNTSITQVIKPKITNKLEASNVNLPTSRNYEISGDITSEQYFDTIFFKIPKNASIETYEDVELNIYTDVDKFNLGVDFEGDTRIFDDKYIYFEPLLLKNKTKQVKYSIIITDQKLVFDKTEIILLDSKDYKTKLAITTKLSKASPDLEIISRKDWGANEEYRYLDSSEWKIILESWKKQDTGDKKEPTEWQKSEAKKEKEINDYLVKNYSEDNKVEKYIKTDNGRDLAWPIQKTNYVKGIIIHHTDSSIEGRTSEEIIRSIYYYHSITRGWGDIGYNYLIGPDGKIFEGRAGGDYTVGAHTVRNNRSNFGIALIGNYENDKLTIEQEESLNKLVSYISNKYGIDLEDKRTFHKKCSGSDCTFHLSSNTLSPIIGHRDAGLTLCPGKNAYSELDSIRQYSIGSSKNNELIPLNSYSKDDNLSMMYNDFSNIYNILSIVEKNKDDSLKTDIFIKDSKQDLTNDFNSFDKNNKIKIKLSYPDNDSITIKFEGKEYLIKRLGDSIIINGKTINKITLRNPDNKIVEISSWNRVPTWDKNNQYNDNKFKGDLTIYSKLGKLIVVNEVYMNDYLKGLGEVSESNNPEKIKTIIVAARTYGRWYMTEARKFSGEYYDGSDNPDEFQKYLGYGFQERAPKISQLVDETQDEVITYNGKIVKPWYFNQSNGKTLSYLDYCLYNGNIEKNCNQNDYPYLKSVDDPGSQGEEQKGHGVGISGLGATYFAEKGWNYKDIIKYFLSGVEIEKIGQKEIIVYGNNDKVN